MEGRTLPSREVGSCGGKEGLGELCMDERRRGEELEEVRFDGDVVEGREVDGVVTRRRQLGFGGTKEIKRGAGAPAREGGETKRRE
uniref:OSJNBa0091D06.21 protein n=1 Tax=Oryza sativa subsp. japonica TaxID=39947 RepID=Q7XU20_ORYSJ|nr:OSJNBa0091D06.21 [Oryza sativa Japonica Group]